MSRSCDETYNVYDETWTLARKEHDCVACELPIRKGDRYMRAVAIHNGRVNVYKRCARCQFLHEFLRGMGRDSYEALWPDERLNCGEDFEEHWGSPPPDFVAELAFWLPGEPLPVTNRCYERRGSQECWMGGVFWRRPGAQCCPPGRGSAPGHLSPCGDS